MIVKNKTSLQLPKLEQRSGALERRGWGRMGSGTGQAADLSCEAKAARHRQPRCPAPRPSPAGGRHPGVTQQRPATPLRFLWQSHVCPCHRHPARGRFGELGAAPATELRAQEGTPSCRSARVCSAQPWGLRVLRAPAATWDGCALGCALCCAPCYAAVTRGSTEEDREAPNCLCCPSAVTHGHGMPVSDC